MRGDAPQCNNQHGIVNRKRDPYRKGYQIEPGPFANRPSIWTVMPYYIYELSPPAAPRRLGEHDQYRAARNDVRERRKLIGPGQDVTVRMVFAPNPEAAVVLLTTRREAPPLGEE